MSIVEISAADLESFLVEAKLPYTLVEFSGPNCSACRLVAGILDSLQEEFGEYVLMGKVEADERSDFASRMSIRSVPTLVLFEGGREIKRGLGLPSRGAIRSFIESGISSGS